MDMMHDTFVDLKFESRTYDLSPWYEDSNVWFSAVIGTFNNIETIRFHFKNEEDRVLFILKWS